MSCIKSPKAVSPKVVTSVNLTPKTAAGLIAWAQFVGLSPERLASELVAEQLNAFKRFELVTLARKTWPQRATTTKTDSDRLDYARR